MIPQTMPVGTLSYDGRYGSSIASRGRSLSPGRMESKTLPLGSFAQTSYDGRYGSTIDYSQGRSLSPGRLQTMQFGSGPIQTTPLGSGVIQTTTTFGSGPISPSQTQFGTGAIQIGTGAIQIGTGSIQAPQFTSGSFSQSPPTIPYATTAHANPYAVPSHISSPHQSGHYPAPVHTSESIHGHMHPAHASGAHKTQPAHSAAHISHHTTGPIVPIKPTVSNLKEQLIAEFIGTFLLVFTVGCNVLSDNKVWAGVSIASVLMVMIYAFGKISGGNFNPAVTLALFIATKMGGRKGKQVGELVPFIAVQIAAGIIAGFCYYLLFGYAFNLAPAMGFTVSALVCELLYTCVLCFVVLNVAAVSTDNYFYGLAIGFVVVAGAYAAGAISGGCFNPAVAIGIDLIGGRSWGIGWALIYMVFEFLGAALAAALFFCVRPWESYKYTGRGIPMSARLLSEFLGTFVLVVTVGLNVMGASKAGAFSIAASLMCMVYALGDVSGANFNPAVTLAIFCCGKVNKPSPKEVALYILAQIVGGIVGGFVYTAIYHGHTFPLGPQSGYGWAEVAIAEILFTFVLCLVVLCVAVSEFTKVPHFFGLAIGSCITVGGFAIGSVSGGSLNPAVSFGIASTWLWGSSAAYNGGIMGQILHALIYSLFEFIGAIIAAQVVNITHKTFTVAGPALASQVVAEFIGTFFLVFTIGCNILGQTPVWGGVSIACVLMVMIYALGNVSGAHFNPAVSLTQGIMNTVGRKDKGGNPTGKTWKDVAIYIATQIIAGILAGFCYYALFDSSFHLAPARGFSTISVLTCELLYTFMLCFVVLNVTNFKNSWFGLAIGFVIVAGAYGAGAVSGGCFNPAVAIGVDVIGGYNLNIGYALLYVPAEFVGAILASFLFLFIRRGEGSLRSKLVSEFIGTFMLVLTVGLNILAGSPAGAFSIAASLMCMIYALGDVSGAHFNPAVTLAVCVSERDFRKAKLVEYAAYMLVQLAAGVFAAFTCMFIYGFKAVPTLGTQGGFGLFDIAVAEFVFTFVLCLVVLCVAVKSPTKDTPMFGLAIGSCVTVGGFAIGKISGGSLNPAVSIALASPTLFHSGWFWMFFYSIVQFAAAIAAAGVTMITHAPFAAYYKQAY